MKQAQKNCPPHTATSDPTRQGNLSRHSQAQSIIINRDTVTIPDKRLNTF